MKKRFLMLPLFLGVALVAVGAIGSPFAPEDERFLTSDRCLACHKGVSTPDGVDVSIGFDWRASMMANSARDPYWQAAVRRESIDHPSEAAEIENECSRCHMPMANEVARSSEEMGAGEIFANLPGGANDAAMKDLAMDGVSCAVCHQIGPDDLGTEASFVGGFTIARDAPAEGRRVYGPFEPDAGGASIMHSATAYQPEEGSHVQTSELCASCHTLLTHALGGDGVGPEFPEQVPYQEWQASRYPAAGQTCQSCHMPEVADDVPVTGVLGRARPEVSRHVFRGGNFFMLRMLDRYRNELGVTALPQEMQLAAMRTEEHLRDATATLTLTDAVVRDDSLHFDVAVSNLAGHKFPTAYPSRRAWLHVEVLDEAGRTIFESGAFRPDGRIEGNDNDDDETRYEPHRDVITDDTQVQIYEAVMLDEQGAVTTGLLQATRWAKDNRLLPEGFTGPEGSARIGVYGAAGDDESFGPGRDRIAYRLPLTGASRPATVTVELWFQPIGYRWAQNLAAYDAFETNRFVRYYDAMSSASAIPIATTHTEVR